MNMIINTQLKMRDEVSHFIELRNWRS